jgi:integrase
MPAPKSFPRVSPAKVETAQPKAGPRADGRAERLTDDYVSALVCPEGRPEYLVTDAAIRGFAVRVRPNGTRGFLFFYKFGTKVRKIPLGTFGEVTAAKARKTATLLRAEVVSGGDPWATQRDATDARLAAERAAREAARQAREAEKVQAFTVKALVDLYAEKHVAKLRPATRRDVLSRLRLHLAPIMAQPADAIDRKEAADVVDRAAEAGDTTARRVRDYARAMWGWARDRGTLPATTPNPWETVPAPGSDVPRERALNDSELGLVWRATDAVPPPHGLLVRFLLLTLARREEVAAMTWGEVAPDLSTWEQPGSRTKNGKPHVVHLSEPARAVLREVLGWQADAAAGPLPPRDALVFPAFGGGVITSHSWVKRKLDGAIADELRKAGETRPMPAWVLHDFRRSGVTWLAGAGFPPHVADRLLNHLQGTIRGVQAIYQKGEFLAERRAALEAWGAHVLACGEGRAVASNIASLDAARAGRVVA